MTTRSTSSGKRSTMSRKHSRQSRLTRLRRTAPPTRLEATSPRRARRNGIPSSCRAVERATSSTKCCVDTRFPSDWMRWKSALRRIRRLRSSVECGGSVRLLLVGPHREALAALAAAIGQDPLPPAGLHARTKTVRSDTAEVVGLIRALHEAILGGGRREASISAIVKPALSLASPTLASHPLNGTPRRHEGAREVETVYGDPAALTRSCPTMPARSMTGLLWGRTKSRNE